MLFLSRVDETFKQPFLSKNSGVNLTLTNFKLCWNLGNLIRFNRFCAENEPIFSKKRKSKSMISSFLATLSGQGGANCPRLAKYIQGILSNYSYLTKIFKNSLVNILQDDTANNYNYKGSLTAKPLCQSLIMSNPYLAKNFGKTLRALVAR